MIDRENFIQWYKKGWQENQCRAWKEDKYVGTITTRGGGSKVLMNNLKIRKLTPCETWLLMGFDKEDFKKVEKVNSNTQLYKQAGNSIVVNVLEAILKNLLLEDNNEIKGQMTIFDLMEDK